MIGAQRIELVFFEGCPNLSSARDNLRSALQWGGKETQHGRSGICSPIRPRSAFVSTDLRRYSSTATT